VKVIKPFRLATLSRTFELGKEFHFSVAAMAFFPLQGARELLPEMSLWKFLPEVLGPNTPIDAAMPKSRGEFLVSGKAFPAGGKPEVACSVSARLGTMEKSLLVVGDRAWRKGAMSAPEPFTEKAITWENAFGGLGFAVNPVGKGFAPVGVKEGKVHPLPNVEWPQKRIGSIRDRPAPAGFAPIDFTWPQRFKKLGTYDKRWLKERYPGFAADIDWSAFNVAPDDQQCATGFFRGDEQYTLRNLHPSRPSIEGVLPSLAARCFVTLKTPRGEEEREIPTKLDTVWFFPDAERGVLIFHGSTPVQEDDGADVLHLVMGFEELGAPRPVDHYRRVLAERLDKKKAGAATMRDRDLVPEWAIGEAFNPDAEAAAFAPEGLLSRNLRKKAAREVEQRRQYLVSLGLDPDVHGPKPVPLEDPVQPKLEELDSLVEQIQADAEKLRIEEEALFAEREKETRRIFQENGLDFDEVIAERTAAEGGPPTFTAAGEVAKLEQFAEICRTAGVSAEEIEGYLADPVLRARYVEAEKKMREAYRLSAHMGNPARLRSPEDSAALRAAIASARSAGESLARRDFTGADLSGVDLSGADLTETFLERANLAGANLSGADCTRAVFTRANLSGANLAGVKLCDANLGEADLRKARLEKADLTGAIAAKADLSGADLRGVRLDRADLGETKLAGADMSGLQAEAVLFHKTDLSRLKMVGAVLTKCNFIETTLEQADFTEARLEGTVLISARARGAVFRRARLANLRAVLDCHFEEASFQEADLTGANLRGCHLDQSDLSHATLVDADLSEASLRRAQLSCAVARKARFVRADLTEAVGLAADLMETILQKATLVGADLRGANLYGADMARVLADDRLQLSGANVDKVRIEPRRNR
jgi:uncharacterized protein YjbI with pentapeptide repeats